MKRSSFFDQVFGATAAKAVMGEYTVLPNGIIERAGHADQAYIEIRRMAAQGKVVVFGMDGEPIVLECDDLVRVSYLDGTTLVGNPGTENSSSTP